jgi:hypothetical protein
MTFDVSFSLPPLVEKDFILNFKSNLKPDPGNINYQEDVDLIIQIWNKCEKNISIFFHLLEEKQKRFQKDAFVHIEKSIINSAIDTWQQMLPSSNCWLCSLKFELY